MKKFLKILAVISVVLIVFIVVLSLLLSGEDEKQNNSADVSNKVSTTVESKNEKIYEDDHIKVSFIEMFEEKSVSGTTYIKLLVENKSDESITVSLKDAFINDMSVNTGSGVPMNILPGKSSQQPFILFTGAAGINSVDDIKNVEFKVMLLDDDTSLLEETKQIKISIK